MSFYPSPYLFSPLFPDMFGNSPFQSGLGFGGPAAQPIPSGVPGPTTVQSRPGFRERFGLTDREARSIMASEALRGGFSLSNALAALAAGPAIQADVERGRTEEEERRRRLEAEEEDRKLQREIAQERLEALRRQEHEEARARRERDRETARLFGERRARREDVENANLSEGERRLVQRMTPEEQDEYLRRRFHPTADEIQRRESADLNDEYKKFLMQQARSRTEAKPDDPSKRIKAEISTLGSQIDDTRSALSMELRKPLYQMDEDRVKALELRLQVLEKDRDKKAEEQRGLGLSPAEQQALGLAGGDRSPITPQFLVGALEGKTTRDPNVIVDQVVQRGLMNDVEKLIRLGVDPAEAILMVLRGQ